MARSKHYYKYHRWDTRSIIRDVKTFAAKEYCNKRHTLKMALQLVDIDAEDEIIEKVEAVINDVKKNASHWFWFD